MCLLKTVGEAEATYPQSCPKPLISFDNGVVTVPAYLCTPWVIDKSNIGIVK